MKNKLVLLLWAFAMLFVLPVTITSCGDEDEFEMELPDDPTLGDSIDIPSLGDSIDVPSPGDSIDVPSPDDSIPVLSEMSPIEQKEFMEQVALNLLDEFSAKDFESVVELTEYLANECEDYKADEVEDWFEGYLDDFTTFIGQTSEKNYWGEEHYNNYERLYMLSNVKGKFTAKNYKWVYEKADDLQFVVKDMYGQTCVAKLTTSGNVKKVYIGSSSDWIDYNYDSNKGMYHEYYNVYENTIAVPERMELTLTQGGKTVAKVTLNTNLSSMKGNEFDLSKDSYSVSANVVVNDYEINISNVSYNAGRDASVSYNFKHNGKQLISMAVFADVNIDFDDEENSSCKNANVNIDILGDIQIKGKCNNVIRYCEYLEEADDNDDNENQFKSYINMANSLLDLGIYYRGQNYKYAKVVMEPTVDKTYYYEHWDCDYVIYFNDDNTTYALFEIFFNNKDFKSVINKFEDLIESFSKLSN